MAQMVADQPEVLRQAAAREVAYAFTLYEPDSSAEEVAAFARKFPKTFKVLDIGTVVDKENARDAEQGGANQPATAYRAEGELIIEVLLDGNVIVENEKFSKEQLKKKLLEHPDSNKNLAVALTMGPNVAYKHTINIYNICLEAGFPNIGWRGLWKEQTEQDARGQLPTRRESEAK